MIRYLWSEIISVVARHVSYVTPSAILEYSCSAYHHIRVDIYRVNRVCHTDVVIPSQDFLNISCIAFGSIVYENLIYVEMNATR